MIDLSSRCRSSECSSDMYAEERQAAFRYRADEAIADTRDQGEQHPVLLVIQVGGPRAHPLSRQLVLRATEIVRQGRGVSLDHTNSAQAAFVFSRAEALRVLEVYGRGTLGRDFRSLFSMTFEPWKFLKLTLVDDDVQTRLCSPAAVMV